VHAPPRTAPICRRALRLGALTRRCRAFTPRSRGLRRHTVIANITVPAFWPLDSVVGSGRPLQWRFESADEFWAV